MARPGITRAGGNLVRTEGLKRKSEKRLERRRRSLHWIRVETVKAVVRERPGGRRPPPPYRDRRLWSRREEILERWWEGRLAELLQTSARN